MYDARAATRPIGIALAVIYFHFGVLKFFPDLSSAEMLATQTVLKLRLGLDVHTALFGVGLFEVLLALGFALQISMRIVFPLFALHMAGTMLPLLLLPGLAFKFAPFAPTLVGQYILKNLVLIAAGWALYRASTPQASEVAS